MKGKLGDQPLVELIREISSKGLSGTLRLQRARAQAAAYFEQGQLVFAAANLRPLRLRSHLEKLGSVSRQEIDKHSSNGSDLKLLANLRDKGVLTSEQVEALLANVVSDVLRVVLLWTEGEWEFDERARLDEQQRVDVDAPNLLREASHRMPLKFVASRFRNPNETFARAARFSKLNGLLPAESFILSRLDAPTKLEELVAISGLREPDALRMIYGLALSGCVTREHWQNAFRTGAAKETREQTTTPLFASKFEKDPEEAELELFLNRVSGAADHYEVLDLPLKAEPSEIKDAYYNVARRYHPDRFHLKSGTTLHTRLGSAFAQVTQAYEALIDANTRTTYDNLLQRTRQFQALNVKVEDAGGIEIDAESNDKLPEQNFREGLAALQQGRLNAAVNHLSTAARAAPNDAKYRANYGKALAAGEGTRRLAEVELQAAVKLDPTNASYRILLAELYYELRFHRRAQTELERALALDPRSAAANALLRKLQNIQKTG